MDINIIAHSEPTPIQYDGPINFTPYNSIYDYFASTKRVKE
jgi:hypothetical protein